MNLADMVSNFTKTMGEWIARGAPTVSPDTFQQRAKTCLGCEHWQPEAYCGQGRCGKCGCTVAKLYLGTAKCPIDKWGPEVDQPGLAAEMLKRARRDKR